MVLLLWCATPGSVGSADILFTAIRLDIPLEQQFDETSLTAKEGSSPFGTRPARTRDISPEFENMFMFV